ncbi:MAG TPA: TraR/DksA C4-type zinc finger protein [Mycobacteriales bacterium]|nr:TraR/DksA C4-type zinc finger protein [Mycobacteriales bacterium]
MNDNEARRRLEDLLSELERSAAVLQRTDADDTSELSTFDQHPADSGTNLADADREEATLEVLLAQQERVREALARVEAGTYGRCVDCGRELPDERLEARPEAERCVECQQKVEARR